MNIGDDFQIMLKLLLNTLSFRRKLLWGARGKESLSLLCWFCANREVAFRVVWGRSETSLISEYSSSAIPSALSNFKCLSCLFRQIHLSECKAIPAQQLQKCCSGKGLTSVCRKNIRPWSSKVSKWETHTAKYLWWSECPEWVTGIFNRV